jgi:hypothetical protein
MRLAAYVMCERHTVSRGVNLGVLFNNIAEIEGQVGLTDLYRGGMEVFRYGDPTRKPTHAEMAGFALFAVGRVDPETVRVKLLKETPKGEQYLFSWPKTYEIDDSVLCMVAADHRPPLSFFDYVSEFIKVVEAHELHKATRR